MMKFYSQDEYLEKLTQIFESLKIKIYEVLPQSSVDHIGSSAIYGALSKGDLDILVRVDQANFFESIASIQSLGFEIKKGTLRTEELCMLYTTAFQNEDVAIQIVARGSEFEFFITFRDILNSSIELVQSYNQLKLDSVNLTPEEYRAKKSIFIERVLSERAKSGS